MYPSIFLAFIHSFIHSIRKNDTFFFQGRVPVHNLELHHLLRNSVGLSSMSSPPTTPSDLYNDALLALQLEVKKLAPPKWRAFLLKTLVGLPLEKLSLVRHALRQISAGVFVDADAPVPESHDPPEYLEMMLSSALEENAKAGKPPPSDPARLRFALDQILNDESVVKQNDLQHLAEKVRCEFRQALATSTAAHSCGAGLRYLPLSSLRQPPTFLLPRLVSAVEEDEGSSSRGSDIQRLLGPAENDLLSTPLRREDNLVALYTHGDGNCLFHAVAIGMFGVHDYAQLDKTNAPVTVTPRLDRRGALREAVYQSLNHCDALRAAIKRCKPGDASPVEDELKLVKKNKTSVGNGAIYALANILRRPIICLCACQDTSDALYVRKHLSRTPSLEVNGDYYLQQMMNGIYLPNLWKDWDTVADGMPPPPLLIAYVPGHFVAVVRQTEQSGEGVAAGLITEHDVDVNENGELKSWRLPVRFPSEHGADSDRETFTAIYGETGGAALSIKGVSDSGALSAAAAAFTGELERVLHSDSIGDWLMEKRRAFEEYQVGNAIESKDSLQVAQALPLTEGAAGNASKSELPLTARGIGGPVTPETELEKELMAMGVTSSEIELMRLLDPTNAGIEKKN
jgi:hypothetical protein